MVWSKEKRELELLKCEVACMDCHRVKTNEERKNINHGTTSMYASGCRCRACKSANNQAKFRRKYKLT